MVEYHTRTRRLGNVQFYLLEQYIFVTADMLIGAYIICHGGGKSDIPNHDYPLVLSNEVTFKRDCQRWIRQRR